MTTLEVDTERAKRAEAVNVEGRNAWIEGTTGFTRLDGIFMIEGDSLGTNDEGQERIRVDTFVLSVGVAGERLMRFAQVDWSEEQLIVVAEGFNLLNPRFGFMG